MAMLPVPVEPGRAERHAGEFPLRAGDARRHRGRRARPAPRREHRRDRRRGRARTAAGNGAAGRAAVGARRRAAPRPVHRAARPRPVLDRSPSSTRMTRLGRSARHHHRLRRRGDADLGHRAGERRRGAVLDGARPRAGRARGAELPAGGELGGADRAARHHRPHVARRAAARPRADRSRAPGADRRALACRGASPCSRWRCATSSSPATLQDAMSREAQATREKQRAHHPRRGRGGDRARFRRGVASLPEESRPRCTCAR